MGLFDKALAVKDYFYLLESGLKVLFPLLYLIL